MGSVHESSEATFCIYRRRIVTAGGLHPVADRSTKINSGARAQGNRAIPGWGVDWRLRLVDHLGFLCRQLWRIGITAVFADGSFIEDKSHPNDIDGYFESEFA